MNHPLHRISDSWPKALRLHLRIYLLNVQFSELEGVFCEGGHHHVLCRATGHGLGDERDAAVHQVIEELLRIAVQFLDEHDRGDPLLLREPHGRQGGHQLADGEHGVDLLRLVTPVVDVLDAQQGAGREVGG